MGKCKEHSPRELRLFKPALYFAKIVECSRQPECAIKPAPTVQDADMLFISREITAVVVNVTASSVTRHCEPLSHLRKHFSLHLNPLNKMVPAVCGLYTRLLSYKAEKHLLRFG
jgi:hypothetical protein